MNLNGLSTPVRSHRHTPSRAIGIAILSLAFVLTGCGGGDTAATTVAASNTTADPGSVATTQATDTTAPAESPATTAAPAETGVTGTCRILDNDLIEIDVVSPGSEVTDVYVVMELGKANGSRDEVTVKIDAMKPGEHAVHPFGVVNAVDSDCEVLEVDALAYFGERSDADVADVTCEVVDEGGSLAALTTVNNSGAEAADYIMIAGFFDSEGTRRYSVDVSESDIPVGEETVRRRPAVTSFDYVDGLTCSVSSVFRRPER